MPTNFEVFGTTSPTSARSPPSSRRRLPLHKQLLRGGLLDLSRPRRLRLAGRRGVPARRPAAAAAAGLAPRRVHAGVLLAGVPVPGGLDRGDGGEGGGSLGDGDGRVRGRQGRRAAARVGADPRRLCLYGGAPTAAGRPSFEVTLLGAKGPRVVPASGAPVRTSRLPLTEEGVYEVYHTVPNVLLINGGQEPTGTAATATSTGEAGGDETKKSSGNVKSRNATSLAALCSMVAAACALCI
ncbi:hypothetical protein ISF_00932 [Cordyceps fumosorosea ARSEF 2679]|uniref:Uncharacterized protein n=1 Tax=Cordyceps fumosorosea (strain ARSEF 2679) TaxID=1081104 RepID=A0A168ENN8_CORFA|nr:hypothetical protein ISF_00932 [Cordyceps fumosorosea ARSEF 2679]OAA74031.1 hypothetical protein ISF_00932 [Cordyceps fumosorosea ARSEF 2679]